MEEATRGEPTPRQSAGKSAAKRKAPTGIEPTEDLLGSLEPRPTSTVQVGDFASPLYLVVASENSGTRHIFLAYRGDK